MNLLKKIEVFKTGSMYLEFNDRKSVNERGIEGATCYQLTEEEIQCLALEIDRADRNYQRDKKARVYLYD
jgi:hypothetical protein